MELSGEASEAVSTAGAPAAHTERKIGSAGAEQRRVAHSQPTRGSISASPPRRGSPTMALAQYRSRRDAERSCPWFDHDGDDSMTRLPAIAEQAYDEEATASTTERAPRDAVLSDLRERGFDADLARLANGGDIRATAVVRSAARFLSRALLSRARRDAV